MYNVNKYHNWRTLMFAWCSAGCLDMGRLWDAAACCHFVSIRSSIHDNHAAPWRDDTSKNQHNKEVSQPFFYFPWANQRSIFCDVPWEEKLAFRTYSRLVIHADDVLVTSVMTINGGQSAMCDGGTQMWKFPDWGSHFPIVCSVSVNTGPRSGSSWDTWHVLGLLIHTGGSV